MRERLTQTVQCVSRRQWDHSSFGRLSSIRHERWNRVRYPLSETPESDLLPGMQRLDENVRYTYCCRAGTSWKRVLALFEITLFRTHEARIINAARRFTNDALPFRLRNGVPHFGLTRLDDNGHFVIRMFLT